MKGIRLVTALAVLAPVALSVWRRADERALAARWRALVARVDANPLVFDPDALQDLPEPARRFLIAAIRPGTPLYTVAEIAMHGDFSLGTKEKPDYQPMRACQLLAPPHGFVWQVRVGQGALHFVGSDAAFPGGSWTRFWLASLLPVARMGGNADHALSSFGRYMAEAIFWSPGALMPSDTVRWEALDSETARVTIAHEGFEEEFVVTVDASGRPTQVSFQRWSDANPEKAYRRQPFGGFLSDFREFDGFQLPTTVEAGNHFGSIDYFPFFRVTIDSVRFITSPDSPRACRSP